MSCLERVTEDQQRVSCLISSPPGHTGECAPLVRTRTIERKLQEYHHIEKIRDRMLTSTFSCQWPFPLGRCKMSNDLAGSKVLYDAPTYGDYVWPCLACGAGGTGTSADSAPQRLLVYYDDY